MGQGQDVYSSYNQVTAMLAEDCLNIAILGAGVFARDAYVPALRCGRLRNPPPELQRFTEFPQVIIWKDLSALELCLFCCRGTVSDLLTAQNVAGKFKIASS